MNLKKIQNPFGGLIYYKESTTSTMLEARNLLTEKDIHGSIFITDNQTNGLGRIPGRVWYSTSKENLTFTLILEKDILGHGYVTIPLKVGLALSDTLKEVAGLEGQVKWPNDVVVDGKKISGILCQSDRKHILIGVGLNVNQQVFDEVIRKKATSLSVLTNNGYSLEMVLSVFLKKLQEVLNNKSWLDDLNRKLYRQGEKVNFAIGDPAKNNVVSGTLVGLDSNGKVIIKNSENIENSYISGEFI